MSEKFGLIGGACSATGSPGDALADMFEAGRRAGFEREQKALANVVGTPAESQAADGIRCPRCKGTVWTVFTTRHESGRIVRVRTCSGCRLRVRTREVIEAVVGDAPAPS